MFAGGTSRVKSSISMPKIKIVDLMTDVEAAPIKLGMTLNKFAMHVQPPSAWTFPWTTTFPASIEYGDLLITLDIKEGIVRISGMRVGLRDTAVPEEGDPYPVARTKAVWSRKLSLNLEGFCGGQSIEEVACILDLRGITHTLHDGIDFSEIGKRLIANRNTIFNFCCRDAQPWLMSIEVFHPLHPYWPLPQT